jgi:molecular chaperone DnaK (HSP70)
LIDCKLEVWCHDLFEWAMVPVKDVLQDAYSFNYLPTLSSKLGSNDELTVLMCGGSSYIPKVKEMLSKLFPTGTNIYLPNSLSSSSSQLSPELAVAYGAALAGKRLNDLRHAPLGYASLVL